MMFTRTELVLVLGSSYIVSPRYTGLARYRGNITEELGAILSTGASITTNISSAARWSDYHAPQAGYMVNVAEEQDVSATVKYCNKNGIKFLAQAGGNGWANTFDMDQYDVIINLRGLDTIVFSDDKALVRVGGGTLTGDLVDAAHKNDVQILSGGCDCVGVMGLTLGGGASRFMNRYGIPADNLVSANLVTATGEVVEVSETSNPELLWAIRGAGANFGIVTSAVLNAYPTIDSGRMWAGELIFSADKLEAYIKAINQLNLTEDMTIHWGFNNIAPNNTPVINAEVFFMSGDAEAGRTAFRTLYDIGPVEDTTQVVDYTHLNDDTIGFCEDGGRKSAWHVGLKTLDYFTFQSVWDSWIDFIASTGLYNTGILVECYSNWALRQHSAEGASWAHRDINFYAMTIPVWEDASLDAVVEQYGSTVRDLWRATSGFKPSRAYINFAHGDEPLEEIYGESLPRLRQLKQQWDPNGIFDQWFPII